MQIKALSTIVISLSATAVFAVANVAFAESYESTENISSISVAVADNTLNPSDIKTRHVWNEQSGSFVTSTYYDIYDYNNFTLTVSYLTGEEKSYTGTEIAALSAKTEEPFIISDDQSEKNWTIGSHTVTCYFGGKSDTINFTVKESKIKSVTVTPQYDIKFLHGLDGKKETVSDNNGNISEIFRYDLEEQYYEINITYTNGSTARYTNTEIENKNIHSLKFVQPEGNLPVGKHTASCYLDGVKADFSFQIIENSIQEISLSLPEGMDTLTFSKDGITDINTNGKPYPRFFYDISSITAKIIYKDGATEEMPIGQLCRDLQDELVFDDNQEKFPWQSDKITLKASIRNIPCSLSLNIQTEGIETLSASVSQGTAKLSWDRVFCAGYELRVTGSDGSEKTVDIPFGTESYRLTKLTPTTKYTCKVYPYVFDENDKRQYATGATKEFTTDSWDVTFSASAVKVSDSAIVVYWSYEKEADYFTIEQNISDTWVKIADITDTDATNYTVTGLLGGTKYQFRINAYTTDGNTAVCNDYTTTKAIVTAPDNITGFSVVGSSDNTLRLSWDENKTADGYIIEMYKNGEWFTIAKITENDKTTYQIGDLQSSTAYSFRARSYKTIDDILYYSSYTKTLSTYTNPSAVTGLCEGGRAGDALRLNWNKNSTADGYIIEQYKSGKWVVISKITDPATTTLRVSGLSGSTEYTFRMRCYKTVDDNVYYSTYTDVLKASTNPLMVSGLKIGGRAGDALRLNWNKNNTADGYIIEQYKSGKWVRIAKLTDNSITTYRIAGLNPSTYYKFRIRAYKMYNSKALYSKYRTITLATNPSMVAGLCAGGRAGDALRLNWNKNNTADGYIIEQYKSGKWVRIAKLTDNSITTYRIAELNPSTSYKFRVRTYKMYNSKALYSKYRTITLATNPSAVKNLRTAGKAKTALRFSWDKNSSADGYLVYQYKNGNWVRIKKLTDSDIITYRAEGLTKGTKYRFFVSAYKIINGKAYYSARKYLTASTIS